MMRYSTKTFCDIWPSYDSFNADFQACPFHSAITRQEALYYLLYAKYGNSPIANNDENQFKFKIYSVIFESGPTWEKRLEIQERLRALTEEDILKGGKTVFNHANNPSMEPSTETLDELAYINDQNTTNTKKSKMEAYGQLWNLLATDVTSQFLAKFKICFKQFVLPEHPAVYVTDIEEEEDND